MSELPSIAVAPVLDRAPPSRRDALRLFAAGITSGLAACGKPDQTIVPYVRMPERLVPGEPMRFATTLPLSGWGRGVLVTAIDGRPIKVEGNPRHPASLGATDVFAEAAVLSLYDPERSRTFLHDGDIASAEAFRRAIAPVLARLRASGGGGFRLLTGPVTSPTLLRQIDLLLERFPKAAWHVHDPVGDDAARAGTALAYGRPLDTLPRLERAAIVLTLDADPLGHGPDQMRHARGFAARRRPAAGAAAFSRLYALEAAPTLTGAKADHRLALPPDLMGEAALAVANALGAGLRAAALPPGAAAFVARAVADLRANEGAALVLAGRALSPEAHATVTWVNARLRAPVDLVEPADRTPAGRTAAPLAALAHDLAAGRVDALVTLGTNPGYDAPADLDYPTQARRAGFRLHMGRFVDETAALSTWHVPQSHDLESWSDARATDGTASLVQPLVRPLYGTWSEHELLALLAGEPERHAYDIVRDTWRAQGGAEFEGWWMRALHDGVVAESAAAPVSPGEPKLPTLDAPCPAAASGLTVVLRPDPGLWDGSFSNNAWLQECPKPLTKQVWGNALALNATDIARLGLGAGDVVRIERDARRVEIPVTIEPGLPDGVASLTLGYGRRRAGAIGNGVGADASPLRTTAAPWTIAGLALTKTGRREEILAPQTIVRAADQVAELYPSRQFASLTGTPAVEEVLPSFLPERPRPDDGHAWAMVIDASLCIGCNACVVACQSENNVPVVGPEEIARGRDMHWLRIDVYDTGTAVHPKPGFQPVPCMHCEHAPCEAVCPVAASVHDGEGLNVQVYNRCIGTRFCEANCPYKVRRFNFFGYADGQEYANLGLEPYRAQRNPDVTVRARGVMEKCTYCVQRISGVRRRAEREDRPIGPDEVVTACQSACPTRAITFGDLLGESSTVARLRRDERHYALLGHLGTRPRTTYLADLTNPAAGFAEDRA